MQIRSFFMKLLTERQTDKRRVIIVVVRFRLNILIKVTTFILGGGHLSGGFMSLRR